MTKDTFCVESRKSNKWSKKNTKCQNCVSAKKVDTSKFEGVSSDLDPYLNLTQSK